MDDPRRIIDVFDRCAANHVFPLLDHPYVFLAASRLALYRSAEDWALVIETFGYNPRAGGPIVCVWTAASRLHARDTPERHGDPTAYANYLALHPHDDVRFFYPCDHDWIGEGERVNPRADHLRLRGERLALPPRTAYHERGVELAAPGEVRVYELCRWLAATHRDEVLANAVERRCSVRPEMGLLLSLDEWHHPRLLGFPETPGGTETFRQLAEVLASGDAGRYRPTLSPNNHWSNWPAGGTL
jgi:hypothetical protein